ncbi:MAG: hypothetical protein CMB97_00535 [Flavobacteriaceae bacterium]|nr:hypothetical protein [Flavobacteriaceae bacterium]
MSNPDKKKQIAVIKRNFLVVLSGDIGRRLLNFLIKITLSRISIQLFGQISFALNLITYPLWISNAGLSTIGTKRIARDNEAFKNIVVRVTSLRFLISLVATSLFATTVLLTSIDAAKKILIILFSLSVPISMLQIDWAFNGLQKMHISSIGLFLFRLLYLFFILSFYKKINNTIYVPFFYIISLFCVTLYFLALFLKTIQSPDYNGGKDHRADKQSILKEWREFLRESIPIGLANILTQLYFHIDMTMIGFMKNDIDVGLYSAAFGLAFVFIGLRDIVVRVVYPYEVKLIAGGDTNELSRFISTFTRLGIMIGIPLGFGGFLLGDKYITLIYTANYLEAAFTFKLLTIAVGITFINIILPSLFYASDLHKHYMKITMFTALFNIILNGVLIPILGIEGAAIATVITHLLSLTFFYLFAKKLLKIRLNILNTLIKVVISCVVMLSVIILSRRVLDIENVFYLTAFGFSSYGICIVLFKTIPKELIKFIKNKA